MTQGCLREKNFLMQLNGVKYVLNFSTTTFSSFKIFERFIKLRLS